MLALTDLATMGGPFALRPRVTIGCCEIGLHREIGGMHGSSRIVSCVPRVTIVPESTVLRGNPEKCTDFRSRPFWRDG